MRMDEAGAQENRGVNSNEGNGIESGGIPEGGGAQENGETNGSEGNRMEGAEIQAEM